MVINKYVKGSNDTLSNNFTVREFDCPCSQCGSTLVSEELVARLQGFRDLLGVPIKITSGYRCANYQNELRLRGYETAVGTSQHELGGAADCMQLAPGGLNGSELEKIARHAGFRAVGVGSNWVHVDCRDDKDRRWEYKP